MRICGECEGYFDKIDVAIVILSGTLRVGDRVVFETSTGLFEQVVESMQINRKNVQIARPGSDIGMKVYIEPRKGGTVYRVT
ncbi:translation elongation factor-like protein [Patescibacteria group bacterium]|nr:translation elongation factor-like protein [Patescibacteria group bacterium]